jgi:GT2 family glycosyltransferase
MMASSSFAAVSVAVVIPNLDGELLLPGCLEALRAQTHAPSEVVVVDNGSRDRSLALLAERHPEVRVLALRRNHGFAGGANAGVAAVGAERVAVLNSDARPRPDWIERLLAAPAPDDVWAWGSVLLEPGGRVESAGDWWSDDGHAYKLAHGASPDRLPTEPYEVFSPPGAAPLFRRDRFLALGGYEEGFFLYFEDIDLAYRALLRGWRALLVPDARVEHDQGASGRGWQRRFYVARNSLRCAVRCVPEPDRAALARGALRRLGEDRRRALAPFDWAGRLAALAGMRQTVRERRAIQATCTLTAEQVRERLRDPPWAAGLPRVT